MLRGKTCCALLNYEVSATSQQVAPALASFLAAAAGRRVVFMSGMGTQDDSDVGGMGGPALTNHSIQISLSVAELGSRD